MPVGINEERVILARKKYHDRIEALFRAKAPIHQMRDELQILHLGIQAELLKTAG
jgi:hypothetical protein